MTADRHAARRAVALLAVVVLSVIAAFTLGSAPAVADTGSLAGTRVAASNLADGEGFRPIDDITADQGRETGPACSTSALGCCVATKGRLGGRWEDVVIPDGGGFERHHMPADQMSPLSKERGPSILMETTDHYLTGSWGSRKTSKSYRAEQQRLVDAGRYDDALQMDIDNIQSLFGDKYDEHILQMIDCL